MFIRHAQHRVKHLTERRGDLVGIDAVDFLDLAAHRGKMHSAFFANHLIAFGVEPQTRVRQTDTREPALEHRGVQNRIRIIAGDMPADQYIDVRDISQHIIQLAADIAIFINIEREVRQDDHDLRAGSPHLGDVFSRQGHTFMHLVGGKHRRSHHKRRVLGGEPQDADLNTPLFQHHPRFDAFHQIAGRFLGDVGAQNGVIGVCDPLFQQRLSVVKFVVTQRHHIRFQHR